MMFFIGTRALMLGSTVDTCLREAFWTHFTHFLRCGRTRILTAFRSPFGLNGELCTVDASGCSLASAQFAR